MFIKKSFKLLLMLSLLFSITSCNKKKSSTEAKELLQKILQVVGIPYDIIV